MRSLDWKQLVEKIIHGNTCLWLVKKESSIFSAQRSTSFRILYCVLVRYTRTRNQTLHGKTDWRGSKVHRNRGPSTELTASQRNSSGIFSRIQYVAAQSRSQKFTVEIRRDTREFHRKNHIHVDVQRHFMGIERQQERMRIKCQSRFSFCKKIWSRTMVIHFSWFWKEVVLSQWR